MSSEVNFHAVPRLFPGGTFRGRRATGSGLLRLALAALALVVACKSPLSRGDGGSETDVGASPLGSASASASASAAPPCALGSVNDCARCGDRCASGFCRAGKCAPAPAPFETNVRGEVLTFSGDGFLMHRNREYQLYSAFKPVERIPDGENGLRPTGYGDGFFVGWRDGRLLKARSLREKPVEVVRSTGVDATLAVDGSEVYFMRGGGFLVVRNGAEVVLPLARWRGGGGGPPTDLALGPDAIYATTTGTYQPTPDGPLDYRGTLYVTDRSGQSGRVVATGHVFNAVATDARWVYWSDDNALFCARHRDLTPRRFLELPRSVIMLGTSQTDLYVATDFPRKQDTVLGGFYRIPLPVCAE